MHSKPSLSVFTQLTMSLVFDLGLNKAPPKEVQTTLCVNAHECPKPPTIRTMEQRRAVLGCFLPASMYFFNPIQVAKLTFGRGGACPLLQHRTRDQ